MACSRALQTRTLVCDNDIAVRGSVIVTLAVRTFFKCLSDNELAFINIYASTRLYHRYVISYIYIYTYILRIHNTLILWTTLYVSIYLSHEYFGKTLLYSLICCLHDRGILQNCLSTYHIPQPCATETHTEWSSQVSATGIFKSWTRDMRKFLIFNSNSLVKLNKKVNS